MVKNRIFFLILLLFPVFAAFAQDADRADAANRRRGIQPSGDPGRISFSVMNEVGYTLKSVFVCKAGDKEWGENMLSNPLYPKVRVTVSIEGFDKDSLYNIRVQDDGGDFYSKYDFSLRERITVRMVIDDLEF